MLADQWFPFFDVAKTLDEVDRAFGCIGRPLGLRSVPRGTFPPINVYEQDEPVVEIMTDKDMLSIVGKAQPEESGEPVCRETYVGDYRRQFTLTADVDPNDVSASMNDDVLTVTVGKAKAAKPKKIKITAAK